MYLRNFTVLSVPRELEPDQLVLAGHCTQTQGSSTALTATRTVLQEPVKGFVSAFSASSRCPVWKHRTVADPVLRFGQAATGLGVASAFARFL